MQARIEDAATDIAQQPLIYRIGRVPGTRELVVHPNYIVIYRVLPDWSEVVGVMHARRKYP